LTFDYAYQDATADEEVDNVQAIDQPQLNAAHECSWCHNSYATESRQRFLYVDQ